MLRVIIVDDEKPNLQLMKLMIKRNKNLDIIGEYTSSNDALEKIYTDKPDAVFLDVEMPTMNGMQLARKIQEYDDEIGIVFTTAYSQYALDAFSSNAVDYILKPVTEESLNITVTRLLKIQTLLSLKNEKNHTNIVECFGAFKVYKEENNPYVKWYTAKSEELFAYFVYNRGEWHDKWKLCDILWGEGTPKNTEHNLHSTINRLKKALQGIGINNIIQYNQGMYRVDFTNFKCDLWKFEDFFSQDKLIDNHNINEFEQAVALYKGELFTGKDYIWSMDLKEKYAKCYINLSKKLIEYYMDNKKYSNAEISIKNLLQLNPFDEFLHQKIMAIYFYTSDIIKLTAHYNYISKLFKKELNIEPNSSTKQTYESFINRST